MNDDKEARRAAALRANLRKRKAQQRARAEEPPPDGREAPKEARPLVSPPGPDPERKDS